MSLTLQVVRHHCVRRDRDGAVILLEDQDRAKWDRCLISTAQSWLMKSRTDQPTVFHVEAAIAMQHCLSPSVEVTDWGSIAMLYSRLLQLRESPVYALNRAIAVGQAGDPREAMSQLRSLRSREEMKNYLLLDCAFARIHELDGNTEEAIDCYSAALSKAVGRFKPLRIWPPLLLLASMAICWLIPRVIEDVVSRPDGRGAWVELMRRMYGNTEQYRKTYGVIIDSFDDIREIRKPLYAYISVNKGHRDKRAFMMRICEEWYKGRWTGPIHLADTGAGISGPTKRKSGYMCRDIQEFEQVYRSHLQAGLSHPQLIGFGWCGYYECTHRSGVVDVRTDDPLEDRVAIMRNWNTWFQPRFQKASRDE